MKKLEICIMMIMLITSNVFGAVLGDVKDNNNGEKGYLLIHSGEINGSKNDIGTWITPKEWIEEYKDVLKGDTGLQGIQGIQGIAGIDGLNGIDGYTPIKGIDYFDGLNGKDGKDFDPIEVTRLDNRIDTSNISITNETSERKNADTKLQNNINNVNSRVDDVSNRVSALEKTQYIIKTELKFIREKHLEVGVYGAYNVGRNVCSEVGLNVVIPIGESYLDRENKRINTRLDRIERNLGQSTVIERVVDKKGKVKSISISQGQLSVNGQF